jgi:hypothetical protein
VRRSYCKSGCGWRGGTCAYEIIVISTVGSGWSALGWKIGVAGGVELASDESPSETGVSSAGVDTTTNEESADLAGSSCVADMIV